MSFGIDLILNIIEKFYYFSDMIDFFPKTRLLPLLGFAVGFTLDVNSNNNGFSTTNLYNRSYEKEVIEPLCKTVSNFFKK